MHGEHLLFLLIFQLLDCIILFLKSGSSSVTQVLVQRGKDVLLNVTETVVLQEDDDLIWRFNKTSNLVRFSPGGKPTIFTNYKGRAEVFEQNHSVQLKNLQAADSGVYDARVVGDKDRPVAEYNVTVQVSEVELNVTEGGGASGSPDSCIVNATCRTADSEISSTFRCVQQTCSQDGGEKSKVTNSGSSLRIYRLNATIICNHSNQWNIEKKKNLNQIQSMCCFQSIYFQYKKKRERAFHMHCCLLAQAHFVKKKKTTSRSHQLQKTSVPMFRGDKASYNVRMELLRHTQNVGWMKEKHKSCKKW
uniref:Immunoglobulin V-set domain-containing protein n=1 Tax=Stegastes partitus TaxID=144197 RepID=A0A3B4ZUB4_9TELE